MIHISLPNGQTNIKISQIVDPPREGYTDYHLRYYDGSRKLVYNTNEVFIAFYILYKSTNETSLVTLNKI